MTSKAVRLGYPSGDEGCIGGETPPLPLGDLGLERGGLSGDDGCIGG